MPDTLTPAAILTWQSASLLPAVVLLALAVASAVVLLYLPQFRRRWTRGRWILPVLRCAALLAVVVSILRPVALRSKTPTEEGPVLLLLDNSRSMAMVDNNRTPAQLVALADALRALPPAARLQLLDALAPDIEQCRLRLDDLDLAQRDLDFARLAGRDRQAPGLRVEAAMQDVLRSGRLLLDRTATLKLAADSPLAGALSELAALLQSPRQELWGDRLRRALARIAAAAVSFQGAADDALYHNRPDVRIACDAVGGLDRLDLAKAAIGNPRAGLLAHIQPVRAFAIGGPVAGSRLTPLSPDTQPDADHTDLVGSVCAALEHLRGQDIRAAVLFSDGRQVGASAQTLSALAPWRIPVFTVALAPPSPARDLAIASVTAPQTVQVGQTFTVKATVRAAGGLRGSFAVQLTGPDTDLTQTLNLADAEAEADFDVQLTQPGPQRLQVSVAAAPGEVTTLNNQAEIWVKVLSDTVNVALCAGSPGWDIRHIRAALAQAPWVQLQEGAIDGDAGPLSLTPDQILQQDVIILYDVAAASLDADQVLALHRLLQERGGNLVIIPGTQHPLAGWASGAPLAALLPFDFSAQPRPPEWRRWPGKYPTYRFEPAPGCRDMPALQLDDDPLLSSQRWDQLPASATYLRLGDLRPGARPLVVERDSRDPVVIESAFGPGRILFSGLADTWQWRYALASQDENRFWLNLVRYAAGPAFAMTAGPLSLDVDSPVVRPGAEFTVRARLRDQAPDPASLHPHQLTITISAAGHPVRRDALPLSGPAAAGRYQATLPALPPGDYQLTVASSLPGGTQNQAFPLVYPLPVHADAGAELTDVSGDRAFLRRLAEATGGQSLSIEQVAQLPDRLAAARASDAPIAVSLWDGWYLFLFVAASLTAEWALRKRFGLA